MKQPAPTTLEAFAENYDGKIRAFLKTATAVGPADLDDLVQDVYLRFHKNQLLERFDGSKSAFTSYLFLICRNVARNKHRETTRRPVTQGGGSLAYLSQIAVHAIAPTQDEQLLLQELRAKLIQTPALKAIVDRVDQTGRLSKKDTAKLTAALRPVLA